MPRGVYEKTAQHGRALSLALKGNTNCLRHGESSRTHRSPEYTAWQNMRARCLRPAHPKYADYGGRGITIDPRWDSFEAFLADIGRRPGPDYSLDRIDNDGCYGPGNLRWATRPEQQRNRRPVRLDPEAVEVIRSSSETVTALAHRLGVDRKTIRSARDGVSWS